MKKIESHLHRRALQADLQQNNAYNPISDESKAKIREMDNVELFELCETVPEVQGWTEEKCIEMDKLAQEDHSYCPSSEEYERSRKNWYISLNKSGRNAPMELRSDFRTAVTIMNRLHRESGEERLEPIPFSVVAMVHSSSSSSTSWWQWNENWWSIFSKKKKCCSKIAYS